DSEDEDMVEVTGATRGTFNEHLTTHLATIREFCHGLEYQRQFRDSRMLDALERDGVAFLRLAQNCLSRERRQNSSRSAAPTTWEHSTTWERSTSNAMFYRSRPTLSD
ncbi:hypothetical protein DFH09DRAFT_833004, partial [Mycena vulgaris]